MSLPAAPHRTLTRAFYRVIRAPAGPNLWTAFLSQIRQRSRAIGESFPYVLVQVCSGSANPCALLRLQLLHPDDPGARGSGRVRISHDFVPANPTAWDRVRGTRPDDIADGDRGVQLKLSRDGLTGEARKLVAYRPLDVAAMIVASFEAVSGKRKVRIKGIDVGYRFDCQCIGSSRAMTYLFRR